MLELASSREHHIDCQPPIVIGHSSGSSQIDDHATVQCQALGSISCAEHAVNEGKLPSQNFNSFMCTIDVDVAFEIGIVQLNEHYRVRHQFVCLLFSGLFVTAFKVCIRYDVCREWRALVIVQLNPDTFRHVFWHE